MKEFNDFNILEQEKIKKYERALFNYGNLVLCNVLHLYEAIEDYEECSLIQRAIMNWNEIFFDDKHILYTQITEETFNKMINELEELNVDSERRLEFLPLYTLECLKFVNSD